MDPLSDGTHAVGAPLRPPSGRLPLRAHRVASAGSNPLSTQPTAGSMLQLPYHPHIQHADLAITSVYLRGIDNTEIVQASTSAPRR
jgi:hypothetical protein